MTVWAHAVGDEEGQYIFTALMRGDPNYEVEVCRVPTALVADIVGGWPR